MIEQLADADSVFGGDREYLANAQAAVLGGLFFHAFGVDLVDRQQQGLAAAQQQAGKVIVGCGQRSAPIDHHHDGVGLIERDPGLAKDFRWNQLRVVGKDAAGIDHASMLAGPLDLAVDPVAGDARFIAHDRTARAGETVEECGFAHIGAADDGQDRPRRSVDCRLAPDGGRAAGQRIGQLGVDARASVPGAALDACGSCPSARPRWPRRQPSQPLLASPRPASAGRGWQAWPGARLSPPQRAFLPGSAAWAFLLWFL